MKASSRLPSTPLQHIRTDPILPSATYLGHDFDRLHLILLGSLLDFHLEALFFPLEAVLLAIELSNGPTDHALVFPQDLFERLASA